MERAPWWLVEEVVCGSCLVPHSWSLELYCFGCDATGCDACFLFVQGRVWCEGCQPGEDGGGDGEGS